MRTGPVNDCNKYAGFVRTVFRDIYRCCCVDIIYIVDFSFIADPHGAGT